MKLSRFFLGKTKFSEIKNSLERTIEDDFSKYYLPIKDMVEGNFILKLLFRSFLAKDKNYL